MRRAIVCAFFGFVMVVAACYTPARGGGSVRNVITQDEIDSSRAANVYELINHLHAEFLIDRGRTSIITNQHSRAVVFLNDQEYGIPETMRNIPVSRISEVRYFTGPEAITRFGSQYGGGVIQLIPRYE